MNKFALSCLSVLAAMTFSASASAESAIDHNQEISFMTDEQLDEQTGAYIYIRQWAANKEFIKEIFKVNYTTASNIIDGINNMKQKQNALDSKLSRIIFGVYAGRNNVNHLISGINSNDKVYDVGFNKGYDKNNPWTFSMVLKK